MRKSLEFNKSLVTLELAPNEFEAQDDLVGLFDINRIQESFLSIEQYRYDTNNAEGTSMTLKLSDKKWTHER